MYYGWVIVAGAFLAQFFVTGFYTYGFPAFVGALEVDFNATRTEIMYGITWATALGLFVAPVVGRLADTWSIRGLMTIGAATLGFGLIFMSYSQNVLQFSILFAIFLCLATNLLGPLTGTTGVARWFDVSRGKALGVAAIGTSVGGMVIPLVVGSGIETLGWRETLFNFGVIVLIVLIPFSFFFIRNYPHDKGLTIENAPKAEGTSEDDLASAQVSGEELATLQILKHPGFWFIGLALGLLFMSQSGVLANLYVYALDLGHGSDKAGRLIFTLAGTGLIGKLLFGYAADRINLKVGLWIAIILAGSGIALLSTEPTYMVMLFAAVLLGLATGGMLPVWGAMIAVVFGMKSYGRVMGIMMPVIALTVMPGPLLAAAMFEKYGNYTNSFYFFIGILLLSFLLLVPLKLQPIEASAAKS